MTQTEKKAYFIAIQKRYRKADKAGKTQILNEFCHICSYHRKYAIRRLSQLSRATSNKKTLQRGRKQLQQSIKSLNPFKLRQQIEVKLKRIFKHVKATSNVRQRL